MSPPTQSVLEEVSRFLANCGLVHVAALFGSRASGTAREASDFDIGFLPVRADLSLNEELGLAAKLSSIDGNMTNVALVARALPTVDTSVWSPSMRGARRRMRTRSHRPRLSRNVGRHERLRDGDV